jgi:uncharacterized protein with PIN domain
MKFACDVMLGALAKWLRVSGHDVFYSASIDRSGLFRVAREEGRTILTRAGTYHELKEIPEYKIIESEHVEEQVKQVYELFPQLDAWKAIFSRCVDCNAKLEGVEKAEVEDRLPPLVKERMKEFRHCPSCKKVYWPGTHVDRMKKFLKKALG